MTSVVSQFSANCAFIPGPRNIFPFLSMPGCLLPPHKCLLGSVIVPAHYTVLFKAHLPWGHKLPFPPVQQLSRKSHYSEKIRLISFVTFTNNWVPELEQFNQHTSQTDTSSLPKELIFSTTENQMQFCKVGFVPRWAGHINFCDFYTDLMFKLVFLTLRHQTAYEDFQTSFN